MGGAAAFGAPAVWLALLIFARGAGLLWLMPVIGGRIEGGHPDKVMFYRSQDNSMRGFRVFAGDLLLVVPASVPIDDAIMLIQIDGRRVVRKIRKQDGGKLLLQSYETEFEGKIVPMKEVLILGHCVRLERAL